MLQCFRQPATEVYAQTPARSNATVLMQNDVVPRGSGAFESFRVLRGETGKKSMSDAKIEELISYKINVYQTLTTAETGLAPANNRVSPVVEIPG
jgi:hypothetical protein